MSIANSFKYPIQLSYHDKQEKDCIHITAYIIDNCNYKCFYCYNRMPRSGCQQNLDKLYKFIKYIYSQVHRKISIELIGGEPTLHPDLYAFCKKISNLQYITNILIFSNFSKDIDFYYHLLNVSSKIQFDFSYHSIDNKINYLYMSKLNQIINIDAFHNRFIASIMFEPGINFKYSKYIFNMLHKEKIGYQNIDFRLVKPYSLSFMYTDDQISFFSSLVEKYKKHKYEFDLQYNDGTIEITSSELMDFNKKFYFKHWLCNAGIDSYYIHCDSQIYLCQSCYIENKMPISTIDSFNLPKTPCICQCENCGCSWGIFKRKC